MKPRLWLVKGTWYCCDSNAKSWGDTPAIAYARWLMTVTLRRAKCVS